MILNLFLTLFLSLSSIFSVSEENKKSDISTFACDVKSLTDRCIKILPEGYTFLKSYSIDGQGGVKTQLDFQYIFSNGTTYIVTIAKDQPNVERLVIRLYDASQREITSSYKDGKYNNYIAYKCSTTGIFHLKYFYEKGTTDFCAGSVLGFKR